MPPAPPSAPEMSVENVALFDAGIDPLAAAMGELGPSSSAAAAGADPLGLRQMEETEAADPLDPLSSSRAGSHATSRAPGPAGAGGAAASPAAPPSDAALDEARARGTDVDALLRLAAAGDKEGVTAALKAEGYKLGQRVKLEGALFAKPKPPPAAADAYQVDFFGVKRGRSVAAGRCARYEARVVQMNHCSGPSDSTILRCVSCGGEPNEHEDLGQWEKGQPMCVTVDGQRLRTLPTERSA